MAIDWIFTGPYSWLDNFYEHPFVLDGILYPTVEHAYQSAKSIDPKWIMAIRNAPVPGLAKSLGQRCPMRPDWEQVKVPIMRRLIRYKFADPDLRERLLSTGDEEIIEGNTWGDTFWGKVNGEGANWLGRLLMEERARIRQEGRAFT